MIKSTLIGTLVLLAALSPAQVVADVQIEVSKRDGWSKTYSFPGDSKSPSMAIPLDVSAKANVTPWQCAVYDFAKTAVDAASKKVIESPQFNAAYQLECFTSREKMIPVGLTILCPKDIPSAWRDFKSSMIDQKIDLYPLADDQHNLAIAYQVRVYCK